MNLARETKPGMGHPFLSAWDYRDKDRKCVLQQGVTDEDHHGGSCSVHVTKGALTKPKHPEWNKVSKSAAAAEAQKTGNQLPNKLGEKCGERRKKIKSTHHKHKKKPKRAI